MKIDMNKKIWEQITLKTWHKGAMWGFKEDARPFYENAISACSMGWCFLRYGEGDGMIKETPEFKKLRATLDLDSCVSIPAWNDDPKRKFHEVLNAFKKADL